MEIALYDLFGQLYGAPTYQLLGGGEGLVLAAVGITAARSQRPATIQVYRREVGRDVYMVREIDAPIRVGGRHWGACRTAYRL